MMSAFRVFLFRQLCVMHGEQVLEGLEAQKARELFCYLIINRNRPHTRAKLASLLWQDSTDSQTKRYLRQTLWQLQSALTLEPATEGSLISVEDEWIQFNVTADVWVDIHQFERSYALVQGIDGFKLGDVKADALRKAVHLYRGDLLENCYRDWCVFERERLRNIYLVMLDKLVGYCEATQAYEAAVAYATEILKCDRAHERTYRRLMRLHYLAGNRSNALREFARCREALDEELGVEPSQQTILLHQEIRSGQLTTGRPLAAGPEPSMPASSPSEPPDILETLLQLRESLIEAKCRVDQEIGAVRTSLAESD